MCAHSEKKKSFKNFYIYTLIILLAIFSGKIGISFLETLGIIIGEIFTKIFKTLSVPIISLAIISTLTKEESIISILF